MLTLLLALTASAQDAPEAEPAPEPAPSTEEQPAADSSAETSSGVPLASVEKKKKKIPVEFDGGGYVKTFGIGLFPFDWALYPDQPQGFGLLTARGFFRMNVNKFFHVEMAHGVTSTLGAMSTVGPVSTGVGIGQPQFLPLNWAALDDPDSTFVLNGVTDRFNIQFARPGWTLTLGRQPVSFGTGTMFTPLDLISPFTPATLDTEVKPGIDAARFDAFFGVSGSLSVVAGYGGTDPISDPDWAFDITDSYYAGYGQYTFGVTDLGLYYGYILGDHVIGASMATGVGPVGMHADATATIPTDGETKPFFRGVYGVDGRPTDTTFISGEIYVQTVGDVDPTDSLQLFATRRYTTGQLWLTGIAYVGLNISQDIIPIVTANISTIMNVTDPSALIIPSIAWSISNNSDLNAGAYFGAGKKPDDPTLDDIASGSVPVNSEFGTYAPTFFMQFRAYF